MTFEGFYDKYLTNTQLRTIRHTNNIMRWKKIVDADLYSKTPSHGIPIHPQKALKGDKVVSVPRFFSQTKSVIDSTS